MKPFISCKCITYGRVAFLEEALYAYLQQEYDGESELVIVNDYPLQKLQYDHPGVKIFNLNETFPTIGEKENFAISQCRGEVIALWDDDDIALPNHLDNIAKYIEGHDYLQWHKGVVCEGYEIKKLGGMGISGMCYTKSIWERVGGHAHENAGYDQTFMHRMWEVGAKGISADPPDELVSWFYMWGNGSYHMSGMGTDDGSRPNVIERHKFFIEQLRQAGMIPTGNIQLEPSWRRDYQKMLKEYLQ